jgi:hypothetical protein
MGVPREGGSGFVVFAVETVRIGNYPTCFFVLCRNIETAG